MDQEGYTLPSNVPVAADPEVGKQFILVLDRRLRRHGLVSEREQMLNAIRLNTQGQIDGEAMLVVFQTVLDRFHAHITQGDPLVHLENTSRKAPPKRPKTKAKQKPRATRKRSRSKSEVKKAKPKASRPRPRAKGSKPRTMVESETSKESSSSVNLVDDRNDDDGAKQKPPRPRPRTALGGPNVLPSEARPLVDAMTLISTTQRRQLQRKHALDDDIMDVLEAVASIHIERLVSCIMYAAKVRQGDAAIRTLRHGTHECPVVHTTHPRKRLLELSGQEEADAIRRHQAERERIRMDGSQQEQANLLEQEHQRAQVSAANAAAMMMLNQTPKRRKRVSFEDAPVLSTGASHKSKDPTPPAQRRGGVSKPNVLWLGDALLPFAVSRFRQLYHTNPMSTKVRAMYHMGMFHE